MRLSPAKRLVVAAALALLLLVGCSSPTSSRPIPQPLTVEDRAELYSLVIRDLISSHNLEKVYLVGWTNNTYGGRFGGPEVGRSSRIPSRVRSGINERLADLPVDFVWVESYDDLGFDAHDGHIDAGGPAVGVGRLVMIDGVVEIVGNIHLEYFGMHGAIYRYRKVDGVWTRDTDGWTSWTS